ncbi:MAG: TIGR03862 family flavoprotein [Paracoccus sp. (in: a-proteobacteria)]|nr:TIGR03862 family flavoprotein [Paracoccus sp. (in: a-proteobacteria)]
MAAASGRAIPALVIGGGPAGLMAAEMIGRAGYPAIIADAMPSPARKFLMAGKSGLNLTKNESAADFARAFDPGSGGEATRALLAGLTPAEIMAWAEGLGTPLFTGSTGRVFPVGMKASPLLRAWLARLGAQGATLLRRWRWTGFDGADGYRFETPAGPLTLRAETCVMALGGASWPQLGSDGQWQTEFARAGIDIAPLKPANMGLRVRWSPEMARHFGSAVKGTSIRAADQTSRGEWIISQSGIEGGGIYTIASVLRDGAPGAVDLAPDLSDAALEARFGKPRGKLSLGNWLRRVLGDPVRVALLLEWSPRPLPERPAEWARLARALPLRHDGPQPLKGAISTAGGVAWDGLSRELELRARPGCFVAGEMLDWEAPTGGYLISGCLATGRAAGLAAVQRLAAPYPATRI